MNRTIPQIPWALVLSLVGLAGCAPQQQPEPRPAPASGSTGGQTALQKKHPLEDAFYAQGLRKGEDDQRHKRPNQSQDFRKYLGTAAAYIAYDVHINGKEDPQCWKVAQLLSEVSGTQPEGALIRKFTDGYQEGYRRASVGNASQP
jgi:hypothetical protein